jgi:serine/threonine-protein kinase
MSLTPGTRVGPYEVVSLLGAGGMGEVYRARDAKLNRDVALKVLPASLGQDPDRLARFRREAQVLASLNHANIAHIHGFEDSGDTHALVMELVEGHTLADRIAHGPMPLADALPIAKQIAEALEAAHEAGVVHRDLKPANIKVRDDGTVKVLDFGLAKALDPTISGDPSASPTVMNSPTLTARATQLGVILGTAAYMAPEQAKGKPVDRRADIWAFGVVLFEMLTGRRGYDAEDISETLAAVLTREVDWTALPAATPVRVKALLRDCLVRDPKQRLRDIGDARRAIDKMLEGPLDEPAPTPAAVAPPPVAAWRRVLPWAIAVLAIAASAFFALSRGTPAPAGSPLVSRAVTDLKVPAFFVNVSRDGTKIVYTALAEGGVALAVRPIDQFGGKVIPGTTNAVYATFSPDGQWLAYGTLSSAKVSKIQVSGGTAITLGDGDFSLGVSWGEDNSIVFAGPKGLMRMSAEGGTADTLTTVDNAKGETSHTRPQFLPGGKQLLFTIGLKDQPASQFAVLDLKTRTYRTVARGGLNGRYVPSGHLTYVRDGTLFAAPFDLTTLSVTGGEIPVVERVSTNGTAATADYAVSDAGLLVYLAADAQASGTTLAWADRKGVTEPLKGQSTRSWGTGRLSPDGRRVANAIDRPDSGGQDLWVLDVERGTPTRLTFAGNADFPVWTPDSKRIIYSGNTDGKNGVYQVSPDASGPPTLLLSTDTRVEPSSVSPDGRTLLYTEPGKKRRIMVVTLSDKGVAGEPKPLHDTSSAETDGEISPDGRWVAYVSAESGAPDIYLHAFPSGGAKIRVSTEGANRVRWSHDGRELVYWTTPPSMSLVRVATPPGAEVRLGAPEVLFKGLFGTTFDVTPDPSRFLIELTTAQIGSQLAIVTNWFEELRRRAPAKK